MRILRLTPAIALAALLAACGSSAPPAPAHSAAKACKDFSVWYLLQGNNVLAGREPSLLATAVSEAPSGTLYHDMSVFKSDVASATQAEGSPLAVGEKGLTVAAADVVAQDCSSVNPSG
jgi:hypothetical protein